MLTEALAASSNQWPIQRFIEVDLGQGETHVILTLRCNERYLRQSIAPSIDAIDEKSLPNSRLPYSHRNVEVPCSLIVASFSRQWSYETLDRANLQ